MFHGFFRVHVPSNSAPACILVHGLIFHIPSSFRRCLVSFRDSCLRLSMMSGMLRTAGHGKSVIDVLSVGQRHANLTATPVGNDTKVLGHGFCFVDICPDACRDAIAGAAAAAGTWSVFYALARNEARVI